MKNKELTFEDAFSRLEAISTKMESGKLSLEESISAYEESMKLIDFCNNVLDSAEQKVRILKKDENGCPDEEPFECE